LNWDVSFPIETVEPSHGEEEAAGSTAQHAEMDPSSDTHRLQSIRTGGVKG
jgi:hypothetical protein